MINKKGSEYVPLFLKKRGFFLEKGLTFDKDSLRKY